jgi:putative transposase
VTKQCQSQRFDTNALAVRERVSVAMADIAGDKLEASKQFRRVNGHLHLPALRAALERHVAEQTVNAHRHDQTVDIAS